jgi:hypothetical protein
VFSTSSVGSNPTLTARTKSIARREWRTLACKMLWNGLRLCGAQALSQASHGMRGWASRRLAFAGSWAGQVAPPSPEPAPLSTPGRHTIAVAVKSFLSNRGGARIAHATLRKYETFTRRLTALADARGYVMLDQFTSAEAGRARQRQGIGDLAEFLPLLREAQMDTD